MNKDFLTYNQQMRYIRDNKKIICHGTSHKEILAANGYFNLVNGYKTPFSVNRDPNGQHIYAKGTSLDEIYALKLFDDELRLLLFKHISKIESEIRALSAYSFDNINKNNSLSWYTVTAYDNSQSTTDIIKLVSKIYAELSRSKHSYVQNYLNNHNLIPTWVMIKVISFSNTVDFIKLSNPKIKDNLCELYQMKYNNNGMTKNNYRLLIGSLQWLRIIRNSCAHNERVYDIKLVGKRINDNYFDLMSSTYNKNGNKDKLIIDCIIYFKYYLDHELFEKFIFDLKYLLDNLEKKLQTQSFSRVRSSMGIKDISHLDLILNKPKNIRYNFHT